MKDFDGPGGEGQDGSGGEAESPPAPDAEPTRGRLAVIWAEIKGLFWLLVAVLLFHSFIAKPFYIPSISMMPTLQVGDRLFVSKYAYGWSHVSPTIPNPVAIFRWLVLRQAKMCKRSPCNCSRVMAASGAKCPSAAIL